MASICLITSGQLSTNPRLVKEADALTEAGHEVSVVCTRLAAWAVETDREFDGRAWRVAACIPLGPFEQPMRRAYRGIRRRISRRAFDAGLGALRTVEAAWHEATPDLVRAARAVKADLYVAHYPAALPAAARAASFRGVGYAYDAEDFHLGDPPDDPEFDALRAMTRRIEGEYLPDAAYVTAASPLIADSYVAEYGITRPTVILNVFPRSHSPANSTECGTAIPGPSLYWFSQTIGEDRGLECAVTAISIARSRPHLYLRGRLAPGFRERLLIHAEQLDVSDHVHFLAPETPSSMVQLAAGYDVGLAAETGRTANHRVALANKIFTYLLAGIPVLLSDIPAHRQIAGDAAVSARLFAVDQAAALAEELDALLLEPAVGAANRRRVTWELGQSRFNWDLEKSRLIAVVDQALARSFALAHG